MKDIPDKSVDLILTDPPYSIGADKGTDGFGSSKTNKHYKDNWDSKRPDKIYFDEILRIGKNIIIFGGNFFTDLLPVNGHWIVWDKTGSIVFHNPFSDCELAWTNINKKTVKKYTVIQQGFISRERKRFHPTQKPVDLFRAIINDYSKEGIILDPFLGSGTTAMAAKKTGRDFIGIEQDKDYCKIAEARINVIKVENKLPFN
ncbi:MAG: site-specific DNA-methyltransferase [Candidatus Paceibacterota bacterium]